MHFKCLEASPVIEMEEIFPHVPDWQWLTLREISGSQEEMSYISRMRNVIQFQFGSTEDFEYVRQNFTHQIMMFEDINPILFTVLSYTLSKIVKSHVLVHNLQPFLEWRTIIVDNEGFPLRQNQGQFGAEIELDDINMQGDRFLVLTFSNVLHCMDLQRSNSPIIYEKELLTNSPLDTLVLSNLTENWNSLFESAWTRAYTNNRIFFSSRDNAVYFYIKDETRSRRVENVFKQIMEREKGESFNELEILKSLITPYYFMFPDQNYRTFPPDKILGYLNLTYCTFTSQLNLAVKSIIQ